MDVADQIIKVIDKISEKFGIAVDSSAPFLEQLANNIVQYCFYKSTILSIICGLIIIAIIIGSIFLIRKCIKEAEDFYFSMALWLIIFGIIPLVVFYQNVNTVIKTQVFPEQVVIEYVSDQYKKIK